MGEPLDDETLAFAHEVFELARSGATEELAGLVNSGLTPNLTNDKGDTLLLLAAYHDHPPTVLMLLERGTDTARVNDGGQTALGAAVFRQSSTSVRTLLAHGGDPVLGSPSAPDVAAFFDLPEMARLLEDHDRRP